jgi:glycosyltransferase involved in cell wall biosynthesis
MAIADKHFISVILPVYREAEHIGEVLKDIRKSLEMADVDFEIVAIDDGSPDHTWDVLERLGADYPTMRAARLSRNFGKEAALCAGLEMAGGTAVIVMDADGQHPPALLPEMIRVWQSEGVDIVEGVKISRGRETLFNKLSAGLFYLLWNKLSGFELRNASDFKLLNRRAVDAYLQMRERNLFFRGMTAWLGFRRAQIPFEVAERSGGSSGWSVFHLVSLALIGITSFSAVPLQVVTLTGVLFLLFAFVFGIQTLYVYLSGHAVTGFATVIFLLLIVGSLLMISLGIIGEYLAKIYDEVKARPRFLISQSFGGTGLERPRAEKSVSGKISK